MPRNSAVLILFRKKAQGYIVFNIDPSVGLGLPGSSHNEDTFIRSRNNTSVSGKHGPQTPTRRRQLFSPAISPQINKPIQFPTGEIK